MKRFRARVCTILLAAGIVMLSATAVPAQNGQARHDDILVGFHYGDLSNHEGRRQLDYPRNVWPFFRDYLDYMADEVAATSYADFWRWWYILERYKGDEKGLAELDEIVDACLARGIKIKIDLAWSTWWTQDRDWEAGFRMPVGPQDIDDWTHLCDLLARRFRGRIAVWDLQGEANDLEHYWQGRTQEHVYDIYKRGYRVFKGIDPGALIGISGASPSVSREKMDAWYWNNLKNCRGYYDNIPINFFADVADPYRGGVNYYNSVREMLDRLGEYGVEVGMGETSVQWAETTEGAATDTLTIPKQAARVNKMFGQLFDVGMNKFIMWSTEFAPGGGHWPWRWGLRNYEDWWGIWPERFKIPGTQIVYRYEAPDSTVVDLSPEWPRPADPYYPAWEVFAFWAQSAPAGSESMRLPMTFAGTGSAVRRSLGAFQRANNQVVGLVYTDSEAPLAVSFDLFKTGWPEKTPLRITAVNESISFRTGEHATNWTKQWHAAVSSGELTLDLPPAAGFTTIKILPAKTAPDAELTGTVLPDSVKVDQPLEGYLVFRNTGGKNWLPAHTSLALYRDPKRNMQKTLMSPRWNLPREVPPGETAAIFIRLPRETTAGTISFPLRFYDDRDGWFGPVVHAVFRVIETEPPYKLIAHREVGQVRLQWFPPREGAEVKSYEIYRAPGFEEPFVLLDTVDGTGYLDQTGEPDRAYYYYVIAVAVDGRRSPPSNTDNARPISARRILDAEIVAHTVPDTVRIGDTNLVTITVRNTGTKTWDLNRPGEIRYWLQPTQLWGRRNEKHLGHLDIEGVSAVKTGETVTFTIPYVGPKTGLFENHWILYMEVPGDRKESKSGWENPIRYAYFGTPLITETFVRGK